MVKKEYLPTGIICDGLLNEKLDIEILEEIKNEMIFKLYEYDKFIPVEHKRNIEDKSKWHLDIVELLFNQLETVEDLSSFLVFSLKNEKLGIKILRVNKSSYCLCSGLLYGWCTCSKACYAGKLEHFQLVPNFKNFIFIEYIKRSGRMDLLDIGIIKGVNKAIKEASGASLSKIKAIRNNEAGEIDDAMDLAIFEYIYDFLKEYIPRLRDYTYSTNPYLLEEFKRSKIVIRHSVGFNYSELKIIDYPSLSCIINDLEDLKTVYKIATARNIKIFICGGSCKTCFKCGVKNNLIVFVNHDTTTETELKAKIKEAKAFLKELEGAGNV